MFYHYLNKPHGVPNKHVAGGTHRRIIPTLRVGHEWERELIHVQRESHTLRSLFEVEHRARQVLEQKLVQQ